MKHFTAELRKAKKSPETIACYLRHIKAALNWAYSQKLLKDKPEIEMPSRKGTKLAKGRAITTEEFERMLGKVEAGLVAYCEEKPRKKRSTKPSRKFGPEALARMKETLATRAAAVAPAWRRLLVGLWLSGLRIGEAVTLSWDDERFITVDMAGRFPLLRIMANQQKANRDEELTVPPDFGAFLKEIPTGERTGPIFPLPGIKGKQVVDANYASRVIAAIGKAAGVVVDKASGKFASAHDLRRAFGFRWAGRVTPARLMNMMRHADIKTTMTYYVGANAEQVAAELYRDWGNASGINTFVNSRAVSPQATEIDDSQVVSDKGLS